jgi:periplasmic protein TonB
MKNIYFIIGFIFSYNLFGQDTIYLDSQWKSTEVYDSAYYFKIIAHNIDDTNRVSEKLYDKTGQILKELNFSNYRKKISDGRQLFWYGNGQIQKVLNYSNGELNGELLIYWNNGIIKRKENYEKNKLLNGDCFDSSGLKIDFFEYEKLAKFPGGHSEMINFLINEIKYPQLARKNKTQGTVYIKFLIKKDGSISDIKILRSVSDELNFEALRVVSKMPKWEPAYQDNVPVETWFVLPIKFKL